MNKTSHFKQYDSRWGSKKYPSWGTGTYKYCGCGPTAVATIVSAMRDDITPKIVGDYISSLKQGATKGGATYWNAMLNALKKYGFKATSHATMSQFFETMYNGKSKKVRGIIDVYGTKGGVTWTGGGGHYIPVVDIKKSGSDWLVYVKDPSLRQNNGWYSYNKHLKGHCKLVLSCYHPDEVKNETAAPAEKPAEATPTKYKGIDVSKHQGTIDFKKVKADGITHVILRSSYTGYETGNQGIDPKFTTYIKDAQAQGLKIGIYHFSQALSIKEAKTEAEYCLKVIEPYKSLISLPVFIDWEFNKRLTSVKAKNLGKTTCTNICNAFAEVVRAAGYKSGVYCNTSTFNNYVNVDTLAKTNYIWCAQYASKCTLDAKLWGWQYTSTGKVSGISGNVDRNYIYDMTDPIIETKPVTVVKKGYTGTYPTLPSRGYFKQVDKGTNVKRVQKLINWILDEDIKVDGSYGPKTASAQRRVQKKFGLKQDGCFGKSTLAKAKAYKK